MPRTPHSHPKTPPINSTNSTNPTNALLYALIALLGFILIVRLVSLALYPLMDPTEARYAEMARKILELNDWVVLHYTYEQPFWGKPPLSFWGSAVGMWIFGINEFGARIAPFVVGVLVCALFFAWDFESKSSNGTNKASSANANAGGNLNSSASSGANVGANGASDFANFAKRRHILLALASAIILSSSAIGLVSAGAVMTDEFLLLCVGLCMVGFWRCVGECSVANVVSSQECSSEKATISKDTTTCKTSKTKRLWGYAFFVGIGLGLLAKGPLILVLAGVPLVGFVLLVFLARRFCDCASLRLDFRHFPLFSGSVLALLIALPWYVACEARSEGFLEYFIVGEHFKRFLVSGWEGDLYGSAHSRRLGSIWLFFLVAFLPWSVAFVGFLCAFVAKIFGRDSSVPNAQKSSEFKHLSGASKRVCNAIFTPLLANNAKTLYLTLWLLTPLAFFTLSRNVLWTYVLPCALPFSILLAQWIFQSGLKKYIWIAPFVIVAGFGAFIATPSADKALAPYHHKDIFAHFSGDSELLYIGLSPSYSAQFYTHAKFDTLHAQSPALEPFREKIYALKDLKECEDLGVSCELAALLSAKKRVSIAIKSSDFATYSEVFARLAPHFNLVAQSKGIMLLQNF
ncbi:glycosyltransferase family 39 protein [Helicobacter sp. MIT 01-3238]|uniref:ArnT family glycosyltransferase n=1 Tax=Helicobacter sp. MIT 01-3238 TaxID=398627 RepID=UPI000E1E75C6|nr:glycosyltransferase family 39 protein [Helicobacter sp. MIT 01-3238]RDU54518.1 hypothetical protein CQA40_03080 [Helicobacter sp. MIT 01-3238]